MRHIELATAMKQRLTSKKEDEEAKVALAITAGIAAWLKDIKRKYKGRFPNDVRAAYSAVHQAVGHIGHTTATASAAARAKALDTEPEQIFFQRRRWYAWFAGDLKEIIAVRGKMRSDKYPELLKSGLISSSGP